MSASQSRFVAIWASHEARARLWFRLFLVTAAGLVLSLVTTIRVWNRPREVVRIGCDGIPQVVALDNAAYSEPNEREIRAFATEFAVFYARSDSYSILNDMVWCANRMAPDLREHFKRSVRGAPGTTQGIVTVIEKLQRRTQIDPATLEILVDKRPYPWKVNVKGLRQVVGDKGRRATSLLRPARAAMAATGQPRRASTLSPTCAAVATCARDRSSARPRISAGSTWPPASDAWSATTAMACVRRPTTCWVWARSRAARGATIPRTPRTGPPRT